MHLWAQKKNMRVLAQVAVLKTSNSRPRVGKIFDGATTGRFPIKWDYEQGVPSSLPEEWFCGLVLYFDAKTLYAFALLTDRVTVSS
jgi:hypothetical protein